MSRIATFWAELKRALARDTPAFGGMSREAFEARARYLEPYTPANPPPAVRVEWVAGSKDGELPSEGSAT